MFKPKTVFVVGAGASAEFGMPVGDVLAEIIKDKLDPRSLGHSYAPADERLDELLVYYAQRRNEQPSLYRQACAQISRGIGVAGSIDQFIWQHNDNPYITAAGKLAIALNLLRAERAGHYSNGKHHQNILFVDPGDVSSKLDTWVASRTWLGVFGQILVEGLQRANLGALGHGVQIISFNYDRCIEAYLIEALESNLLLNHEEAAGYVRSLGIVHVYGDLGLLPTSRGVHTDTLVPYGADTEATTDMWEVARRIQTYTEEMRQRSELDRIRTAIGDADRIIFLGFGFAFQNMDVLTPGGQLKSKQIFSTGYGFSDLERSEMADRISHMCGWNGANLNHINIYQDSKAYDLMKALRPSLSLKPPLRPFLGG